MSVSYDEEMAAYKRAYKSLTPDEQATIDRLMFGLQGRLAKCGPLTALEIVARLGVYVAEGQSERG